MPPAAIVEVDTPVGMGRKKSESGGENRKTPRINAGIPAEWHALMRRLAGQAKMPVVWWLIDLTAKEAAKAKVPPTDVPALPWIEE